MYQNNALNLLNPAIEVIVHFLGQPIIEGTTDFERKILVEIQGNNCGLVLYRADGLFRTPEYHTMEKRAVYKLYSVAHGSELVFTLDKWRGEMSAVVLMLNTDITKQGNLIALSCNI